ncbi:family 16 glycosylhydrolase [Flammeovirga sp. SubArs3]|uniref:family 16 glycosylhydrolase n=1 Tax=Flammeovirga sp. SubArs3 TaxID=2995316 RepID=UPI00248B1822|nr:family 16 glycosylhydrolase [Flammeovirga sp. SubArs3]
MNKLIRIGTLCVASFVTTSVLAQSPYSDPNNKQGWTLNKEVSDEFNGASIDKDKWIVQGENDHYENNFKGRAPSQFVPHAVDVKNGHLVITTRWEPDFKFLKGQHKGYKYENITTGAIITKQKFKTGYMEIKCKPADAPLSSAFWFTGKGGELDLFEIFGKYPKDKHVEKLYHTSFHDWGKDRKDPLYGKTSWDNKAQLPYRLAADYHVYGCEWGEDFLKLYIDGQLIRCVTKEELGDKWVMNNEQKVWVDNEVFPWKVNPKKEDITEKGVEFLVDYVRVWQRKPSSDVSCEIHENVLENADFDNGLENWDIEGKVKLVNAKGKNEAGMNYIKLGAGKESTISRTVKLKPNTTYVLSASARAPMTNMKDIWQNGWLGVKAFGKKGQQPIIKYFKNEWYRQSIVFTTGQFANQTYIYFTNKWQKKEVHVDYFELTEVEAAPEVLDGK